MSQKESQQLKENDLVTDIIIHSLLCFVLTPCIIYGMMNIIELIRG